MKMKGAFPIAGIIIVAVAFLIVSGTDLSRLQKGAAVDFSGCSWQPDYWFVTCEGRTQGEQTFTTSGGLFSNFQGMTCPVGADILGCIVTSVPSGYNPLIVSSCGAFDCSGKQIISVTSYNNVINQPNIAPGKMFMIAQGSSPISPSSGRYAVVKKIMVGCGTAACSGAGEPLIGAQGCSWKPQQGTILTIPVSVDVNKLDIVDATSIGTSYKYMWSQHLISCPSTCDASKGDALRCSLPPNSRNGITTYQGQQVKYYCNGQTCYYYGCVAKTESNQCIRYNDDKTVCVEHGNVAGGECNALSAFNVGCSMNSDCGDTTRYKCVWNDATLQGTCQPISLNNANQGQTCGLTNPCPSGYNCNNGNCVLAYTGSCANDMQCTQTAPTCNAKQYGSQKCVNGQCQVVSSAVQCCTTFDCASGYFCNSQYKCEQSQAQKPECPSGMCCPANSTYRERSCTDMTGGQKTVCCWDGSCKGTQAECYPKPVYSGGGSGDDCGFLGIDCFLKGVGEALKWLFIGVVVILVLLIAKNLIKR